MKEYAKSFYKSKQWIKCRESYKDMKFGLCERCKGEGKIVHHKIYINQENINNYNITLNYDNLELLCITCHNKEHMTKGKEVLEEGYKFNDEGQLIKK